MYFLGVKKWYYNWVLALIAAGIFFPLTIYMFYRVLKDIFTAKNDQVNYDYLAEEVREETRLEELRKTREAIKQNK
ncbi:hypothetical protein [Phascolarctobacterium sp.]